MTAIGDSEERLVQYLQDTHPNPEWPRRVKCCDSSRSLYCTECCRVLIEKQEFPPAIREGRLRFPFDLDIILDVKERKSGSTGIQVVALANALKSCSTPERHPTVSLYDLKTQPLPEYDPNEPGLFVLFPDKDSVPISTICPKKLVVLDIKWTHQKMCSHPVIASLPKVHLDSPPAQSYFWRWHSAGQGMLSTAEAIYCAAMDVTRHTWTEEERDNLLHILWLFALQRSVIGEKTQEEQRSHPSTMESKEAARALRALQRGQKTPKKRVTPREKFYENLA
eukprot:Nitzschia sp. Nitz4//scaffold4_size323378//206492//207331//NITZ4_000678-RA/size323378-processed-gene-0.366-mRNA-1//-1//CDS//3329553453//7392//frame0